MTRTQPTIVDESQIIDIGALAAELHSAANTRIPISPLSERFPGLSIDDAYRIQSAVRARVLESGSVLRGHKVGLTSQVMQRQLGVEQPDFGYLLDEMILESEVHIPVDRFIAPRVEPEVAFILEEDLAGPGVTIQDAAAAIGRVLPAIEIIDSRISDWKITIADTIADNASSGAVVLGTGPQTPLTVQQLADCEARMTINAGAASIGVGTQVLGNPLAPLAWLANTLGERGEILRAGQLVIPGSFTAAQHVTAGDVVTASFSGVGTVRVRFIDSEDEQ